MFKMIAFTLFLLCMDAIHAINHPDASVAKKQCSARQIIQSDLKLEINTVTKLISLAAPPIQTPSLLVPKYSPKFRTRATKGQNFGADGCNEEKKLTEINASSKTIISGGAAILLFYVIDQLSIVATFVANLKIKHKSSSRSGSSIPNGWFHILFLTCCLIGPVTGSFVEQTTGQCASLTNGFQVKNFADCGKGNVALGWGGTTVNIAAQYQNNYAGGCFYFASWTRPVMNANFASAAACSTGATCICWVGATCSNTEGATVNPSDCMCGTKICDTDEGRFCQSSSSSCSKSAAIDACTKTDGSVVNSNDCACGTTDCTTSTGRYCSLSINTCSKIAACTTIDGSASNSIDCTCGTNECDASTGRKCVASLNACVSGFIPGDVTLSGSTVSAARMGKYTWLGSDFNGKPSYKFSSYFLYWTSTYKKWFIGQSLGSTSSYISWTDDVLRPDLSSNPTSIKAWGSSVWNDETITITSSKACVVANGVSANDAECTCGTTDCDASTGFFCFAASNKCYSKDAACAIADGSAENSKDCVCGSSDCDVSTGRYCFASVGKCSKVAACTIDDGSAANSVDCACGTSECDISTGRKCVFSLSLCTSGFVPGDVTLSGSTVSAARMGKYTWLGSDLNGKPSYKFSSYFLYWSSTYKKWMIGTSLGSTSSYISWTDDVLRPELFPKPAIKAWGSNGWNDETITITSSKACVNANGISKNNAECTCGTTDCDASTGFFCSSSTNTCNKVAACTTVDGSAANSIDCACGSTNCDATTGRYCSLSSNTCSKIAACTATDRLAENSLDCACGTSVCTASTGYFCSSSVSTCYKSPCTTLLLSPSGSTDQSSRLGIYEWIGTNSGGKPAYKKTKKSLWTTTTYYLYWHPGGYWYIGKTLGSTTVYIHWSNSVTTPELSSPSPTLIKVWNNNQWQNEKIIISCWIDNVCSNIDATEVNPSDCMCGVNLCDTSTGHFCRKPSNQCMSTCPINDGLSVNFKSCKCGTSICDGTKGLFCLAPSNQCSKKIFCTNTDGSGKNANDCTCGTSSCTSSTGHYCNSAENKCGDVKCLEGTTFGAESSRDLDTYFCEFTTFGTDWCNDIETDRAKFGSHTLSRPSCNFTSEMTIDAGNALKLIGDTAAPTVLSGMKTTRFFNILGQLTLVDLIVKDGKAPGLWGNGGAFVLPSFGSRLHMKRSVVRDCEASSGGAVELKNAAVLVMEESTITSNKAKYGGGLFAWEGSKVTLVQGTTSYLLNNTASSFGGGFYLRDLGTRLVVTGTETHLVVEGNTAQTKEGGGIHARYTSEILVSSGAHLEVKNNTAKLHGGGGMYLNSGRLDISGNGTRLVVEGNSGKFGGGIASQNSVVMSLSSGARLEVKNNTAEDHGGGVYLTGGAILEVSESKTQLLINNNKQIKKNTASSGGGGGLFASQVKTTVSLSSGSHTNITDNYAEVNGGGLYFEKTAKLKVFGSRTLLSIDKNMALETGGGISTNQASTIVAAGAKCNITNNIAKTKPGGGFLLQDRSTLSVFGKDTLVSIDRNIAQLSNGGGLAAQTQSSVTIRLGARFDVVNNMAPNIDPNEILGGGGGGMFFQDIGTRLDVKGISKKKSRRTSHADQFDTADRAFINKLEALENNNDGSKTELNLKNNIAGASGGGMSIRSGAVIDVASQNTFFNNTAVGKNGGGFAYGDSGGKQDGGTNCVQLSLRLQIDGDKNVDYAGVERSGAEGTALTIRTVPNTALFFSTKEATTGDMRQQINHKNTKWCIPCGSYKFIVETPPFYFLPKKSYVTLAIARGGEVGNKIPLVSSTNFFQQLKSKVEHHIDIPCVEQGVRLKHSRFIQNQAGQNGGAIATPDKFKNAFFELENITFVDNVAGAKGGAIHVSGSQTALDVTDAEFHGNKAASGGVLSVELLASLQMSRATANNNIAEQGDGGFLFTRFASPILMRDININGSATGDDGGGGGIAVYSTQVALERVVITRSRSGQRGGGAVLLDEGAEVHLFDGMLNENVAENGGSGGHIHSAASALVVHSKDSGMTWPERKPIFPSKIELTSNDGTIMSQGEASTVGGSVSCVASMSESVLSFNIKGLSCQSNLYTYIPKLSAEDDGDEDDDDTSTYRQYACPSKGIMLGKGTRLLHSTALEGGGAVSANLCAIEILNATIANATTTGDGGALLISSGSTLSVNKNSTFEKNNAEEGSGGAVSCQNCLSMNFNGSTMFRSNNAQNGGALHISSPKEEVTSTGSIFDGNTAQEINGGALDIHKGVWKSFGDRFESNIAILGSGGAVSSVESKITLDATTSCIKNQALKGGGGCLLWESNAENINDNKWKQFEPTIENDQLISSNQAAYGPKFATPGVSLRVAASNSMTTNNINILNPEYPKVDILDWYDVVVKGAFAKDTDITAKLHESKAELFGATVVKAENDGSASFNALGVQGIPGTGPHQLYFESQINIGDTKRFITTTGYSSSWIKTCGDKSYLDEEQCKSCPVNSVLKDGASSGSTKTVCSCNENFYREILITATGDEMSCTKCPSRSTSLSSSLTKNDCICNDGLFKEDGRCVSCPINSVLKPGIKIGSSRDVCSCKIDYYLKMHDKKMTCAKCDGDHAPHTKTGNVTGVINPTTGCLCAAADPSIKSDKCVLNLTCGYYTVNADEKSKLLKKNYANRTICKPCPEGADCSVDGALLTNLTATPGFWKSGTKFSNCNKGYPDFARGKDDIPTSEKRCCPKDNATGISICKNGTSETQCQIGYTGVLCMTCTTGYVRVGFDCKSCPGGVDIPGAVMATFSFCGFLGFIFSIIFCCSKIEKDKDEDKDEDEETKVKKKKAKMKRSMTTERSHSAVGRLIGDQVMIGRVANGSSGNQSSYKNEIQILQDRVKVVFSWAQILASLCVTYEDIPWPQAFKTFTLNIGVAVNLDLMGAFGWTDCSFNLPFIEKFLLHMSLPVCILLVLSIARLPAYFLNKKHRLRQKELFAKIAISVILIMYPGLCTRIFQVFKCRSIEGVTDRILQADYSVTCGNLNGGGSDGRPMVFVWVFFILYVIGVPFGVWVILRCNRKHLHDMHSSHHHEVSTAYGALYEQYEEPYYWYEVVVLVKKMLLTGAMCVIGSGSSAQVLIAILLVLFFMLLVFKTAPFIDDVDDALSFMTSLQMMLTLLAGFALLTDNKDEYDSETTGTALIAINSVAVVFLILSIIALIPCIRVRMDRCGKKDEDENLTKVLPVVLPKSNKEQENIKSLKTWGQGDDRNQF